MYDLSDQPVNENPLGAAPKPRYPPAVSKEKPTQEEIRALLHQAETASETVKDLVKTCLAQFRVDCWAALDCYSIGMMEEMSSGSPDGLEDLASKRDEKIQRAREGLKTRLQNLLTIAEAKGI